MSGRLEVTDLRAGFGHNTVLHGVSFTVEAGEFAALVGLNGAGKSVTLKCLSGLLRPWSGAITLDGRDITRLDPEDRVLVGLAHVPQGRQVFSTLTVEENLRLGGATIRDKARYADALSRVYASFPRLAERRRQAAGTLSGGEQAMLAVGRALMPSPRLVLIDEPSAGLSPIALGELLETIREVNRTGVTVLMVEQNTTFTLKIADTIHVMQKGTIPFSTRVEQLSDPGELLGYLGVGALMRDRIATLVAARSSAAAADAPTASRPKRATKKARIPRTTTAAKRTTTGAAKKKTAAKKRATPGSATPTTTRRSSTR